MATYSNAIGVTHTSFQLTQVVGGGAYTSGTLYTVPANRWADIVLYVAQPTGGTFNVQHYAPQATTGSGISSNWFNFMTTTASSTFPTVRFGGDLSVFGALDPSLTGSGPSRVFRLYMNEQVRVSGTFNAGTIYLYASVAEYFSTVI